MCLRALGRHGKAVEIIVKLPTKNATKLAELLQQVDRTFVLWRGRKLSYFAGCDYFRLSSHPAVMTALRAGLEDFGLNVAASRRTTGNHQLYSQLEQSLARFFGVEAAMLVSSGYTSNLALAQALAGEFTHALIDERAHACLFDAAQFLGARVFKFRHRNAQDAAGIAKRLTRRAKILLLTDGLFSHSGEVAPLDDYLRLLPDTVTLLVDDAHGAGVLGKRGRGTPEFLSVPRHRIIQTITLSKAFGVYGGAILGTNQLKEQILTRSRYFIGNTPLPLPLAAAALASLKMVRADSGWQRRLAFNIGYIKAALREAGMTVNDGPGPIVPVHPRDEREASSLKRALLAAGIHPPFINYLGGPRDGYFRFVISSEHSAEQLDRLASVLADYSRKLQASSARR
jgi:7-keto-8-aminopelargonate synthetase-like enzyme